MLRKKCISLILLLFFSININSAQILINGFNKKFSGSEIDYHSPHPAVNHALICQATDGKMTIKWEAEKIPSIKEQNFKTYDLIWLAGLGCNLGEVEFILYLNDDSILTFKSWNKDHWKVSGKDKIYLSFQTLMIDKYSDRMGIMRLTTPRDIINTGDTPLLAIRGSSSNSNAWIMVFISQLKNNLYISAIPAIIKSSGKYFQLIKIIYTHLGKEENITVSIDTSIYHDIAYYGINQYEYYIPITDTSRIINIILESL